MERSLPPRSPGVPRSTGLAAWSVSLVVLVRPQGLPKVTRGWSCLALLLALGMATACRDRAAGRPDAAIEDAAGTDARAPDAGFDAAAPDAVADAAVDAGLPDAGPCAADMVLVASACVDRFEAPNREGALPLVMYTFVEAEAWCQARGKRLCFDDEWSLACGGPDGWLYPYGDVRVPGQCNDDKVWRAYHQPSLNGWPGSASSTDVTDLEVLLDTVRAVSPAAAQAADHVWSLYQGEPAGQSPLCTNVYGAYDMQGSVEEWTRRRDGGEPSFHGSLKGRYWAEPRTCQGGVLVHGDYFRFYEIGFRCCRDPAL